MDMELLRAIRDKLGEIKEELGKPVRLIDTRESRCEACGLPSLYLTRAKLAGGKKYLLCIPCENDWTQFLRGVEDWRRYCALGVLLRQEGGEQYLDETARVEQRLWDLSEAWAASRMLGLELPPEEK